MTNTESNVQTATVLVTRIEGELGARGIDLLLMLSREDSDPVASRLLGTHVVAETAFCFAADGNHIVLTGRTDVMAYETFPFFAERIAVEERFDAELGRLLDRLAPSRIALNISEDDPQFDGLRWGLHAKLGDVIGAERLAEMEVSSEPILKAVFA